MLIPKLVRLLRIADNPAMHLAVAHSLSANL